MKYQALCIGNSSFDILIPMDGYPSENEKYTVNETIECGGGPAANAAYLLSLWGAECWFAGIAGDDACGGMIRGEFTGVSTNLSLMEFRKGYATPLSLILANTAAGTRTILHRKGNTAPLGFPPVPPEALKPSLILTDGHEPEAARAAMDAFPDAHTVLDAGSVRKGILELSPLVDFLIASERFAADY
ncbi:MAG: hypothetical protein E4H36_07880 [Spirochaetales bacterium]|nr:MAG: hypothetical protein E4H36_07880 [Spirochaetales bacterium]